jgi:DNA polymerase
VQGSNVHIASRADALSALAWLVEAGVDMLVDETPRAWLADETSVTPEALPALAPAAPSARPAARPTAEAPVADIDRAVRDAATLVELRSVAETLRANPIFADGEPASGVMIVGQDAAPDDDRTGRPFSGPSGALLDRMLKAIGRDRSSVYLTNLYLWRTIGGRPATDEETRRSTLILRRHIEIVRPRALLVMGDRPSKALFDTETGITKLRGRWIDLDFGALQVPALPTFNPAYLLRVPQHKALAWADLLAFKSRIDADA